MTINVLETILHVAIVIEAKRPGCARWLRGNQSAALAPAKASYAPNISNDNSIVS